VDEADGTVLLFRFLDQVADGREYRLELIVVA
jgi:hypothetical protein